MLRTNFFLSLCIYKSNTFHLFYRIIFLAKLHKYLNYKEKGIYCPQIELPHTIFFFFFFFFLKQVFSDTENSF